jgi:hypothetical protein
MLIIYDKRKITTAWLFLGPVLAFLFSLASWYGFKQLLPSDKILDMETMIITYPLGLLMSLLTPWGWLMYGGLLLIYSQKLRMGISCTVAGALLLGGFWPIWSTAMISA